MDFQGEAKPDMDPLQYNRWHQLRNIFDEQIFKNIFLLHRIHTSKVLPMVQWLHMTKSIFQLTERTLHT